MRSLVLLAVLAFALPAVAAEPPHVQGRSSAQQSSEARGRMMVQRNCSMCHAIGKSGASPFVAAPPFRELGQRYKLDDLDEALAEGIITGHPAMPEFRFSPSEVDDIVHYLKSIQTVEAASAD